MSSVAIPASATTPVLTSEADLARRAARADQGAFTELYRRHNQTAWRLAQAVASDRDGAAHAVSDGFVRVLRGVRRHQADPNGSFRPQLLYAVYRSVMDQLRQSSHPLAPPAAEAAAHADPEAALARRAFRSLPERWRAALWMSEVEGLDAGAVAPILGVSAEVATQLVTRGRRGLLNRFSQAHRSPPEQLGPLLRPMAATVPAGLADLATERWRKAVAGDPAGRFVPAAGWLSERASRPLAMAIGGLLGLGIIGLGVLNQHTNVTPGGPVALSGAPAPDGSLGVNSPDNGFGFPPGGGPIQNDLIGTLNLANRVSLAGGTTPGGTTLAAASGSTPAGGSTGPGSGGATTSPSGASGSTPTGPGGGSTPSGGNGAVPGGPGATTPPTTAAPGPTTTTTGRSPGGAATTTTTAAKTTSPTTLVNLGGLASVTSGNGSTSVNVLPGTATHTTAPVQVNVGQCTGVKIFVIGIGCTDPNTTTTSTTKPPATTSTTANVVTGLVNGVGGLVNGLLGGH